MSAEQAEKHYIITRAGLEEFYDALALVNGKAYADKVWDLVERDTEHHSRPHNSGTSLPLCDPSKEYGVPTHPASETCKQCKARTCCVIWDCPLRNDIAAHARADERKRVLDKIENHICNNSPWVPGTDERVTDARKMIAFARSLRTPKEQP